MDYNRLIREAHDMAVDKGWWDNKDRSQVEQVNNFLSELMEAWEEYRCGRMELWFNDKSGGDVSHERFVNLGATAEAMVDDGYKPESFFVELADFCIRAADTIGNYRWEMEWPEAELPKISIPDFILEVSQNTAGLCNVFGWNAMAGETLNGLVSACVEFAKQHDVDLWELIELKMRYNATRPKRHGGKLA